MFNLGKIGFIEENLARAMGSVIGSISGSLAQQKAGLYQHKMNKARQDEELRLYRMNR